MNELDTNRPSTRQIQNFIKDQQAVEIKLVSADIVEGKIRWQDSECVCIVDPSDRPTLVWRQSILYLKPKS